MDDNAQPTNENILVVDDQPGVRFLLREILEEEGYGVELAKSGMEALDKLSAMTPELILLDMKMPGLNGLETIEQIEIPGLREKVVLMSAYGDNDLINKAMELGVVFHIRKPFDLQEIKDLVKKAIGR